MRSLVSLILLFLASPLFSQSVQTNDSIRSYLFSYQYQSALDLINKQIIVHPDNAGLYKSKGQVLKNMVKYPEAIYAFGKAFAKDSSDFQVCAELAFLYKTTGNYRKALDYFEKAGEMHPQDVSMPNETAGILTAMEEYEKAKVVYLGLYLRDTLNFYFLRNVAKAYENLDRTDSADFYYEKAVRLNPSDFQSVFRLSNIYLGFREYKKAITLTEGYRRFDPSNQKMKRLNAYAYFMSGNYKIAVKNFYACISTNDTVEFVYRYLGMSFFRLENYDSSRVYLEKALRKDTLNVQTCYALGIACSLTKYKKEGISYLNRTLELINPAPQFESEVLQHLADAYTKTNQYQKGLKAFLKANEVTPDDTLLKFRIASHYDQNLKNKKMALKYYRQFMKTKPVKKESHPTSGVVTISYYSLVEKRIKELEEDNKE
jgi:tetratricopeptide (TPR) repeat protein